MKYFYLLIVFLTLLDLSPATWALDSTCYGSTKQGRLEQEKQLPFSGQNYVSYSLIAHTLGRTYVHSEVHSILLKSYADLSSSLPHKVFKYAETGFRTGGKFRPHKTHQNGLSVDFIVPALNEKGESVHIPTNPLNRLGYNIEFDSKGRYKKLRIDFDAMAEHIYFLHKNTINAGHKLWRVIFDPELQAFLFDTPKGEYLKEHIKFSKKRSWVRHDEHYHVDFDIPCKNLN